jgi:zinc finger protein
MSFSCDHCNFSNCEVQSAGEIQERGAKYVLKMDQLADMERQIVKSDSAVFRIEDLDLEVPAGRGRLTNVEGVLTEILEDLKQSQDLRKQEAPELYEKIETVVATLQKMIAGDNYPYTISLNDPTGNSWIEPSPVDRAGKYTKQDYARTPEQNEALGLSSDAPTASDEAQSLDTQGAALGDAGSPDDLDIIEGKVYTIPLQCPGCTKPANMNIQTVNIPYFKQVIISAVVCEHCGYKTNDVKTGGEFPDKGQRIWLDVESPVDLRRDILKSETCCLKIPECSVEVQPGTMGGRFTTVEGLVAQVRDDLRGSIFDVDDVGNSGGDSMQSERKEVWDAFFAKLDKAISGELKFTILMEDPLANSYVQSLTAPEPDPQIRTEDYIRSVEEEEELGLNDMKTHQNADGEYVKEQANGRQVEVESTKPPEFTTTDVNPT